MTENFADRSRSHSCFGSLKKGRETPWSNVASIANMKQIIFLPILFILLSYDHWVKGEESQCLEQDSSSSCKAITLITAEELAGKTGQDGGDIWLSILGEVFDVTGGADYYGIGAGYGFFAGKDASVTFVSGQFNEEGLKKSLDDLEVNELRGVESWRLFYRQHETYKFKGLLIGELYDSEGKPTPALDRLREKLKAPI